MGNGICHVRIVAGDAASEGLMVIAGNAVNGGGSGYLYRGRLTGEERDLRGRVAIRKWDGEAAAVLWPFKEAIFDVRGRFAADGRSFRFEGRAAGHAAIHLTAEGRFLAAAAPAGRFSGAHRT